MKKVLLAAINARYSHSNLALLYLRGHVSDLPFEIEIAEYSINLDTESILRDIRERNPHAVAFSVYIWNTLIIQKIMASLHEEDPALKIILGGPEVTFNAPYWLSVFPFITAIITGGGETGFRKLLIDDLSCQEQIINEVNPPFREISFPYRHEDFMKLANRYLYYESSRGCPFRCSYCLSSRHDHKTEFRDMDQVREEIDFLVNHGPRLVKFVDRTFNARPGRSRDIWKYIIDAHSRTGTCFHFEIFPAFLTEEDFDVLVKAPRGLFQFEMGIQSIHEETLRMINRYGAWEETAEKIHRVLAPGNIHVHTDIIAGLPGEDIITFGKSFDAIYRLGAHQFQVGILKVLPGTEMRERTDEYGMEYDSAPPYTIIHNQWIGRNDMDIIKTIGEAVDRIYNPGKFQVTLHGLEKLHASPFSLFADIARFTAITSCDLHGMHEWKDIAGLILEYISHNFPGTALYITDCLRWDWFTTVKDRRYPPLLTGDIISSGKKRLAALLQDSSFREKQRERGVQISLHELKRAKFFIAETREFREEYTGGMAYCLTIPGKELIFLDNC